MSKYTIGAVKDFTQEGTFNSGVLLFDVNKWRKKHITEKIWKYASKAKKLKFADQGLLNDYFGEDYLILDNEFNYQIGVELPMFYRFLVDWPRDKFERINNLLKNMSLPVIYHYSGMIKPWAFTSNILYKDKWWKYLSLSWDDLHSAVELPNFKKDVFIFTNLAELKDKEGADMYKMPYSAEFITREVTSVFNDSKSVVAAGTK